MTTTEIRKLVARINISRARELLDVAQAERYATHRRHDEALRQLSDGAIDAMPRFQSLDVIDTDRQVEDLARAIVDYHHATVADPDANRAWKSEAMEREASASAKRCGFATN